MNEEAIRVAYDLFVNDGYTKSIEEFKKLMNENPQGRKVAYDLFVNDGYTKDINSFGKLMGVSGQPSQNLAQSLSKDLDRAQGKFVPNGSLSGPVKKKGTTVSSSGGGSSVSQKYNPYQEDKEAETARLKSSIDSYLGLEGPGIKGFSKKYDLMTNPLKSGKEEENNIFESANKIVSQNVEGYGSLVEESFNTQGDLINNFGKPTSLADAQRRNAPTIPQGTPAANRSFLENRLKETQKALELEISFMKTEEQKEAVRKRYASEISSLKSQLLVVDAPDSFITKVPKKMTLAEAKNVGYENIPKKKPLPLEPIGYSEDWNEVNYDYKYIYTDEGLDEKDIDIESIKDEYAKYDEELAEVRFHNNSVEAYKDILDIDEEALKRSNKYTNEQVQDILQFKKDAISTYKSNIPEDKKNIIFSDKKTRLDDKIKSDSDAMQIQNDAAIEGRKVSDLQYDEKKANIHETKRILNEDIRLETEEYTQALNELKDWTDFLSDKHFGLKSPEGTTRAGGSLVSFDEKGNVILNGLENDPQRKYYVEKLQSSLDKINLIKSRRLKIQQENITAKEKQIFEIRNTLKSIKSRMNNTSKDTPLYNQYKNELKDNNYKLSKLENDLSDLKLYGNLVFQTNPKEAAKSIISLAGDGLKESFKSMPNKLSSKEKFDLAYTKLLKITQRQELSLGIDRIKIAKMAMSDLFFGLSEEEIEYRNNVKTLSAMTPIYFTNETGVTNEGENFFDAFLTSLGRWIVPNMTKYRTQTEETANLVVAMDEIGIKADYSKGIQGAIEDRSESRGLMSQEFWGESTGLMAGIALEMAATTKLLKIAKIGKLGVAADKVGNVYKSAMNSTKLGKFFLPVVKEAAKAEVAGQIFQNAKEELNFENMLVGGSMGKIFGKVISAIPAGKRMDYVYSVFGNQTARVKKLVESAGSRLAGGAGEVVQEFGEELSGIYNDELRERGFWEEVGVRFGDFDENMKFVISSALMGAVMHNGSARTEFSNQKAKKVYDSLSNEEKQRVDEVIKESVKDKNFVDQVARESIDKEVDKSEAIESIEKTELDTDERINELESMLASDAASMEETGQRELIPEAREEAVSELESLKKTKESTAKPETTNEVEDDATTEAPSKASINEENSSNFANLTEDSEGNFVFFHRGEKGYDRVKKSSGTSKGSKSENTALGKIGGAAMYYTDQNDSESMVDGPAQYSVKVSPDKVYDANSDPLGFREEARNMHEEEFPGQSFDSNTELAYITKVAGNNGFEMVVSEWNGKSRAQTTSELKPNDVRESKGDIMTKDFSETYVSNRDKGYEAVIPKSKFTKLKALYDKINDIRNKEAMKGMEGRYDELYRLNSSFDKYTQEEITELIDKSDLSQEIKDEYKAVISEPTEKRSSRISIKNKENETEKQSKLTRDGEGRNKGRSIETLEGAPIIKDVTGPDPSLVSVAEKYAADNGIDLKRQSEYVEVDSELGKRLADAYEEMVDDPQNPIVKEAYSELIKQTKAQYQALIDAGYEFTFFDEGTDPYNQNPYNAMRDLRKNKKMAVYGTYDGYGVDGIKTEAIEKNPMLADTGLIWKDQNGEERSVTANDLFRAVHDAFGHGLEGAGFRARGEENAWQAHVRLFTGSAIPAITSETRGQNSWLNFGPFGDKNMTAKLEDTVFADQKIGLMPEFAWTEGRAANQEKTQDAEQSTKAQKIAKAVRSLKAPIDLRKMSSSPKPIFDAAWNSTLEATARIIEAGGNIAEAVEAGIKALRESKWYKGLSDKAKKSAEEFSERSLTDEANRLLKEKESSVPTTQERRNKILDGIDAKIKGRNVGESTDPKLIMDKALAYFEGSKEYLEMNSTEREDVYREIRKKYGAKEKKSPTAKRILGKLKDIKNITMAETTLLKKQILDRNRGAKDLKKAQSESKKQLINELKNLEGKGEITTAQMISVISRLEKVDLIDQNSVDSFVDYMADVFSNAEYRKKMSLAKSMSSTARKNIKTKLGQLTGAGYSLNKLFSINPKMIPLSVLDTYMDLVKAFGEKKAVLTVPEISTVKEQMSTIFDAIDEENSTAIVLADRFSESKNKVFDKTGKLNFSESVNKMVKEEEIEESEAKLMKKYKSFIVESESKQPMTEAEIKQEKDDLIKEIKSSPVLKISQLSSRLERSLSKRFEKLLTTENLEGISNKDLKNIVKLIGNINNGYVNHLTQVMVEKLTSVGKKQKLKESILKAKILKVTGLYTKLKSKITKRGYILEMIRRNPLFYIDQIFGDYNSTSMYDSIFKDVASGYANYKTQLTTILKRIDVAMDGVTKSFGRDINKTLRSSFLQQIYLIQLEHDSNVGNKEVNHAVEFLKETIGKLDASTKNSKNIEADILNKILNNKELFNGEGNFDTKKIYDSFNSAEKKSIKILQEQSALLQEKAIFTAAVIRGQTIIPRDNYVHLNVLSEGLEGEMSSPSEVSNYAKNIKPSTKGKSLIERTGGVSALNFNAYSAASKAAKYVLMDFNLTEPIRVSRRTLSGTIKDIKGDKIRQNTEELKIANAINSAFDEAVENVLMTSYSETSLFDDVHEWIKTNGYRAVLASLPRAAAELSSNVAFALIANSGAFTTGAGLGVKFLTSDKAVNSMINLNSTQTTKNYPNGGLDSRSVDITSKIDSNSKTLKARTGAGNFASKVYNKTVKRLQDSTATLADKIISTPDKIVAVPLWFGEFSRSFEKATGLKPDFDKISENNEDYMNKYKSELDEATSKADKMSVMAGASNNPLSGILKGASQNQSASMKVFNTFNNYMQTFLIFEYVTARTGVNGLVTGGGVGRKKGAALIGASATRMVSYTLLSKMFANGMYSILASLFGWDDEEDEDEPTTEESLSNAIASTAISMMLGRDFGNVTKQVINFGVENVNENYLGFMRDGKDYNRYKHSLSYSLMPRDKDGKLSNDLFDYIVAGSGPIAPGIKAFEYAVKKTQEEDIEIDAEKQKENNKKKENIKKKISESNDAKEISALKLILEKIENDEESKLKKINRQQSEKQVRVPLDLLGVMGFVPLYKDINKVYKKALYNGLSNEIKLSKEEKEKSKEDKAAEKKRLGKYGNKTDMKKYDPELYEKTFGEESEFYDEEKLQKEIEKIKREIETDIKDETFNYIKSNRGSKRGSERGSKRQ